MIRVAWIKNKRSWWFSYKQKPSSPSQPNSTMMGQEPALARAKYAARAHKAVEQGADGKDEIRLASLNLLKAEKVERKMFHDVKELRKLLKKAKGFEMQRLVKRIKNAREAGQGKESAEDCAVQEGDPAKKIARRLSPEDGKKFERELEMIKNLDLGNLATTSLRNKIARHGALRLHPSVRGYLERSTAATAPAPAEEEAGAQTIRTIEARLLGYRTVREEVARMVAEMEAVVLGHTVGGLREKKKFGEGSGSEDKQEKEDEEENEEEPLAKVAKLSNLPSKNHTTTHTQVDDDDAEASSSRNEPDAFFSSGSDDDDNMSSPHNHMYDSDGEPLAQAPAEKTKKEKEKRRQAWQDKQQVKQTRKKKGAKVSGSMFVETLHSGGEDEDEWKDPNFEKIYNGAGREKKNRKGQRARRQEWEKKYGREAMHLKLAAQKKKAHPGDSKSNDLRRTAVAAPAPTGANDISLGARVDRSMPAGDVQALHPSWEAKRRQQQVVGFLGKKIVFEEEEGEKKSKIWAEGPGVKAEMQRRKNELHPSWEAKRAEKEQVSRALSGDVGARMNKRIVFD
ncbi:BUD22-domain-containing protein [Endogone sp. FLAS-F59071]|nr:BUD22-domain-containing protein [Endogone sp. FLAS-F59071]|eukprot:RUS17386.1 BUD22-domain-containing protein [Endogone sp. FLAS-F59071]